MYVYLYTYPLVQRWTSASSSPLSPAHRYVCVCVCVCVCVHMYVSMYIYVCIHMYVYVCMHILWSGGGLVPPPLL